jgi:ribosomal protein S18 acetylase RimI-like enzyme
MSSGINVRVRFAVDDEELSALHQRAFGSRDAAVEPWSRRLARHSLTWVGAFDGETLVGFVQLCWDGSAHAFVLDTAVDPDYQRRHIGHDLVCAAATEAARAGCVWLHVDYEAHLQPFYEDSCGFRPTSAGLLHLARQEGPGQART